MGEAPYSVEQGRLANQWISDNPRQFAIVSFRRTVFFWNGLPRVSSTAEWMQSHPRHWAARVFWPVVFDQQGVPRSSVIEALQQTRTSLFLATSLLAFGGLVLALRNRIHGVFLFASLLIFYPLVYYVSFPLPRYRHPIEPMMLILAVYLFSQARSRNSQSKGLHPPPNAR
jgi:hypothetical protein